MGLLGIYEKLFKREKEINKRRQSGLESLSMLKENLSVIARHMAFFKWQHIDAALQEKETDVVSCTICGHSQKRMEYEVKETDCIFGGGHLIRYVCPKCNVIFGPTKFLNLSQTEIAEDYKLHYIAYEEGDSTKNEERAFFMLQPNKKGIYLNYGCGHWSHSLQNLREQGYDVYGYEPYASDAHNPYMITDKQTLSKMRFDGIYSNNLLEHLIHPLEELIFMRSLLLKGGGTKMSHCTPCYEYKYEFTRFHTHFFIGNSVSIMSEKCGLEIVDVSKDTQDHDFICYVFSLKDSVNNLVSVMFIKGDGEKKADGKVVLEKSSILYGPYITLKERRYRLNIKIRGEDVQAKLKVTSKCGSEIVKEISLSAGENMVPFALMEMKENIEFVIQNESTRIEVESICLSGDML